VSGKNSHTLCDLLRLCRCTGLSLDSSISFSVFGLVFVEAFEEALEIVVAGDAYPYGHAREDGDGDKEENGPECLPHNVDLSY